MHARYLDRCLRPFFSTLHTRPAIQSTSRPPSPSRPAAGRPARAPPAEACRRGCAAPPRGRRAHHVRTAAGAAVGVAHVATPIGGHFTPAARLTRLRQGAFSPPTWYVRVPRADYRVGPNPILRLHRWGAASGTPSPSVPVRVSLPRLGESRRVDQPGEAHPTLRPSTPSPCRTAPRHPALASTRPHP